MENISFALAVGLIGTRLITVMKVVPLSTAKTTMVKLGSVEVVVPSDIF